MSRFQKGMLALVVALAAVIAVGYAGMRYLENSVADAIRVWATQTPENCRVTLGDVRYSFKDNNLFLGKAGFSFLSSGQKVTTTIESVEIHGIGDSFLSLLKNPKAEIRETEFSVADSIVARGIVSRTQTTFASDSVAVETTIGQRNFSDIRMNTERSRVLFSALGKDTALELLYAVAYREAQTSDIAVNIGSGNENIKVAVAKLVETNISYGSAENTHLEGITVHLGDTSLCALDSMTVRDVNLPSPAVMSKWMNLTEEPSDSEALALLGDLFMSTGKPMIGEFTMSGLKLTIPSGENVTLGTFRIANPKVDPFTVDVAVEHLVLPLSIDPQLQLLRLTGLQNMDLTTTFSFSGLNASDLFRAAYSLNMAGAGTLDMGFEGSLPAAEWKAAVEKWKAVDAAQTGADKVDPDAASGDIMETLLREHLMLVNMEIGYADEGLLPRGIKLAQISMGLSTEQCLELIRQQIVMTTMGMGSQIPDAAARLNEFIDHPGAVRLTVRPEKPVRFMDIESGAAVPPIRLEVTPGPKTIGELVDALK